MAAERGRPARDDGACDVVLAFCQGVELAIVVEVAAKDVRHLERKSRHLHARRASGVCWHQSRSAEDLARGGSEQVDGTRGAVQMGAAQVQIVCGGSDAGMPQEHLHLAKVGAGFKHMGSEAMALMPSSA